MSTLTPMPEVLAQLRLGRPVLVTDDDDRENEGDAILAAALATPAWVAWMVRYTSGYLCAPMTNEYADRLDLPYMVAQNQDSLKTAYTVTVDAAEGVTTGISATDRARTLNVLADPASTPTSVIRPGHIVPLRARDGGTLERGGHTEAAVDLMKLAGLPPVGVIGELVRDEDGEMMRFDEVQRFGVQQELAVTTVAEIQRHLRELAATSGGAAAPVAEAASDINAAHVAGVERAVTAELPTRRGQARALGYRETAGAREHIALVYGDISERTPLVRVHSECLTGEALASVKCECGPQLDAALDAISQAGGVLVYLRGHEGRGIGLINKLKAYHLQDQGLDTLDANLALGLPADARDFGAAAEILRDLGCTQVRLLTNNPEKISQLEQHGVNVIERVPLVVGATTENAAYMSAKRDRMGHLLSK